MLASVVMVDPLTTPSGRSLRVMRSNSAASTASLEESEVTSVASSQVTPFSAAAR